MNNQVAPFSQAAARRISAATCRWRPPATALLSTSPGLRAADPICQVHPRGLYYDMLLTNPIPYAAVKSEAPPSTARPKKESAQESVKAADAPTAEKTEKTQTAAEATAVAQTRETLRAERRKKISDRARIVFGSRLLGPAERAGRLAEIRDRSKMIAGVLVPPRPEEPDNCCMSGCVDCVWDRFRNEMEGWAEASTEASRRLRAREGGMQAPGERRPTAHAAPTTPSSVSMDDDGGGSNTNWDLGPPPGLDSRKEQEFWDEELYKSLPVGIREFMKQEKRLKMKHLQEGTVGG